MARRSAMTPANAGAHAGGQPRAREPVARLGLCCVFQEQQIRFRATTAKALSGLRPKARGEKLRAIATDNAASLAAAITYCAEHGIGCFRVNSQILPLRTHPRFGYDADLLGESIVAAFRACGQLARESNIRLTFHPDQFVVLSSPHPAVVDSSLAELEHQAEVAGWIGADVINIHGGGGYGDKPAALERLAANVARLSRQARSRLTLENDDRIYTPSELLPVCRQLGLPLVYDVHHHRCHGDGLTVETATQLALGTWDREPLFHLSSPRDGWRAKDPRPHSDMINLRDYPRCWDRLASAHTVEVEAKAKEVAVLALAKALARRNRHRRPAPSRGQANDGSETHAAVGRLLSLFGRPWRTGDLVAFHAREKLLVLAHDRPAYQELGRLVAHAKGQPRSAVARDYKRTFMTALQKPPTRGTQTNVLQHIAGYFKHLLDSSDRRKLDETIESYRSGRAPLADPVALLRRHVRHHVHRHGIAYLAQQSYLTGPLDDDTMADPLAVR